MNALTACGRWKGGTAYRITGFTYEPDRVCLNCKRASRLGNGMYVEGEGSLHLLRMNR